MPFQSEPVASNWPSEVPFASLLIYSPKGSGEHSIKSRQACSALKRGDARILESAMAALARVFDDAGLAAVLGPDVVLVPAPGSAPHVPGGLWPAQLIAHALVRAGRGKEVRTFLRRATAVPKSAFAAPGERPSIDRHYDTIAVEGELIAPKRLTIVDDVITRGRTLFACARRLREAFPKAEIQCFAMVRTKGLQPEVERVVDSCRGLIHFDGTDVDRTP